jgi:large subunit ribosomal protein L13
LANGRINKPKGTKQETVVRTDRPIVVDATNHIAGRLASNVAKLLNCEKIMMSGTRANQIKEYREFLEINSIINYKHGPKHYRRPDTVMAKMIRQMLPFDRKPSGKESFQRLRTYIGSPKEIKSLEKIQFEKAMIRKTPSNYTALGEICRVIGWTE